MFGSSLWQKQWALLPLALGWLFHTANALIDDKRFGEKVIDKDVVIIGGGASGSHAAVRLREDFGKSIVLIEKQNRLVRDSPILNDGMSSSPHSGERNNLTVSKGWTCQHAY
jgi:hypothetical protein